MTLAYLATPYSKYPDGIENAFRDAARLAGALLKAGVNVYSPIAHCHPIGIHGEIELCNHDIWLPFDQLMMDRCDTLIVAHMDGWAESKGIAYEIDYFVKVGKPIYDCDPDKLTMVRRP